MPLHDVLRQRFQPLTSTVTSNRIFLYSVFSTFAVAATIANACRAHSNFYSVSIYLAKSSRSVLILANFGFLCALLSGRIFQRIFFGPLQPREVERLYDQTWMFVTESLLAFTIFRDEFDVPFLLMFGFLLFVKCFHWLMADRVESVSYTFLVSSPPLTSTKMDQTPYPGPPTLFHVRINALFGVLWAIDITMFAFAVESTLTNGVGGMVLFASEYAILLASALNAMLRYALSILDLRRARTRGGENAPPWENKSMYIFYIELLTDFLKLATYMTFFMIILTFYGLPLNIIRDVFVTARSFITRLRALVRYHNATRDMDRRYPDATEAELVEMSDRTCIICREEMHSRAAPAPAAEAAAANGDPQQPPQPPADGPNMTPKKLPCGHIFHFQCLRSWLERQQSCPTCRRTVLDNNTPQNAAQAPGQAARQQGAARPRPGAAPVPGVAPGGAVAGNGPLGWVGRFLGLPQAPALNAQFPGAPGQAQAPFPQGPPQQQQPGFPPPPPGWWGQAPGQFAPPQQPQRQPDANAFADYMQRFPHDAGFGPQRVPGNVGFDGQPFPPPQYIPMQQPPAFDGFWGPQNVWQPWGNPRVFGQQPPVPAQPQPGQQHEQEAAPAQVPRPPSVAAPTGEAAIPQGEGSQAPTPTPTTTAYLPPSFTSETNTSAVNAGNMDARRAAALAAFRRLNPNAAQAAEALPAPTQTTEPGSSALPAEVAVASSSSSTSTASSTPAVADPSAPAPTPTVPAADSAPGQPQPTPTTQAPGHPTLPSLIPLYDTSLAPPPRIPGAPPYSAPYTYTHPAYTHFYRGPALHPSAPRPSASSRPSTQTQSQTSSIPRSARAGPGGSRTPLGQLPPTLTEDQLARLDRLTREAIDERLRVLEGVSGAVYRCMEELTRVRSVLPMPGRRAGQQAQGSSSASAPAPTPTVDAGSSSAPSQADAAQTKDDVREESSEGATPSEDGSMQSEAGEANGTALDASAREAAE
ncbi:ERAD-associated E3 ubiquitin-protein ligase HRD1 [Trametes pubescens]|uniref:RING-type E3 ubiquitin transferase n=1 Tax=Trametes pubescens TaxID=154538 RepID=A0A1M2VU28_TRAPU|nr:ERAD-associated E3 ubiquitin-protein ligase HRD1 [Trametes pubescens]